MKRRFVFIMVLLSVFLCGNVWAADDAAIQELQTDVSVTKSKADKNAEDIQSMKGGLPALERRVSTTEDIINNGGITGPEGPEGR